MSNFQWRPFTEEDRPWQPLTEETKLLPTSSLPSILSSSSVSQLLFPSLWLTSVSHCSDSPFPSPQRSHCEPFLLIPIHLILGTDPDTIPFSKGTPWGAASWQAPSTGKNDLPLRTDAPDGQSEVYGFPARGFTKPCQFPFCHWPIPFHWLSLLSSALSAKSLFIFLSFILDSGLGRPVKKIPDIWSFRTLPLPSQEAPFVFHLHMFQKSAFSCLT